MTHKRMRMKHLRTTQAQGEKYITDFKRSEAATKYKKKPLLNIILLNQLKEANYQFDYLPKKYQTQKIRQFCRSIELSYRNPFQYFFAENKSFPVGEIMATLVRHRRLREILGDTKLVRRLFEVVAYFPIVRSIKSWKPKKKIKGNDLLWDLFLHVFVEYPKEMPCCLKRFFLGRVLNNKEIQGDEPKEFSNVYFMLHMANGFGLHSFNPEKQKLKFNSKMNFYFKNSPEGLDLSTALKWTLLKHWKINNWKINFILEENYSWEDFFYLEEAFHFFARNKRLGRIETEAILKFLFDKKNGMEIKLLQGRIIQVPFIFPDFSFKKRSVDQVLGIIKKWQEHVQNTKARHSKYHFKKAKFNEFEADGITIRQIKNSIELREEGKIMEHCVGTYLRYCLEGRGTIWTLEQWIEPYKKLATIEVNKQYQVVQIKGKRNKEVKGKAFEIIKQWSKKEDLNLKVN